MEGHTLQSLASSMPMACGSSQSPYSCRPMQLRSYRSFPRLLQWHTLLHHMQAHALTSAIQWWASQKPQPWKLYAVSKNLALGCIVACIHASCRHTVLGPPKFYANMPICTPRLWMDKRLLQWCAQTLTFATLTVGLSEQWSNYSWRLQLGLGQWFDLHLGMIIVVSLL